MRRCCKRLPGDAQRETTMQQAGEPKPLTYTNVTEHDRIWKKETPDHYIGLNNTENFLSPPLKHITPETTQELWENFDPLDVLDSGSDSSADTMIMMTTEEEERNEERVKNSYIEFELRKKLNNPAAYNEYSDLAAVTGPPACNGRRNGEEEGYHDDGYGTDNRSNTTPSLSSPLSSSLSSLLTSESSSSQGSLQRNLRGVGQRQAPAPSNARVVMSNAQNSWVPKRKVRPVETQDNSLEEKLRALTTIVEEEGPVGVDRGNQAPINGEDEERGKNAYKRCHSGVEGENGRWLSLSATLAGPGDGFYRAVPVTVIRDPAEGGPQSTYDRMNNQGYVQQLSPRSHIPEDIYNRNDLHVSHGAPSSPSPSPSSSSSSQPFNPHDRRYGQPVSPETTSPLSPRQVKNTNQEAVSHLVTRSPLRSPPFQGLSKNPSMMYSMPADLNTAGEPSGPGEGVSLEDMAAVRMRKRSGSSGGRGRSGQPHDLRHSWDQSAASAREALSTSADNMTPVGSIIDIPKLEMQMRACSELALGINRPVFASSSDIYKLFQGQRQSPATIASRQSACRHSFHAMPSGSWPSSLTPLSGSQDQAELRHRLKHASIATPSSSSRVSLPLKASHEIQSYSGQAAGAGDRLGGAPTAMYNGGVPSQRGSGQGGGVQGGETPQSPHGAALAGGRPMSASGRSRPTGSVPVNGVGHGVPMTGGSGSGVGGGPAFFSSARKFVQDGHVPYTTRTVADSSGEKLSTLV